jgi:hypothetical protein
MPALAQTLPANDLGFLRIVASLWGIELHALAPAEAALELAEAMLDAELMEEIIAALPDLAREALQALLGAGGRLPWVQFARRFGDIREMGPGKRDREQPHARPNSAAETLYYRALIGKAFFDTPSGSQEFAFLPDDLAQALEFIGFAPGEAPAPQPEPEPEPVKPPVTAPEPEYADLAEPEYADLDEIIAGDEPESVVLPTVSARKPPVITQSAPPPPSARDKAIGRAATPAEKAHIWPATDHILDDLTTLLAALRLGIEPPALAVPTPVLTGLLTATRLISPSPTGKGAGGEGLQPEAVKAFLESPRQAALASLVEAWQTSETFNELRLLPGLAFEGAWDNQPLVTREFLLNLLEPIPEGVWWSIPSFIRDIKQRYPDFQRPAGDYDTWFIKRLADGQYLRGFAHWEDVDGALIRYFFQVLHWLGQIDLAAPDETAAPTAFRITSSESRITNHENAKIVISSNALITVPRLAPRSVRYQVARFCDWGISPTPEEYRYRITPASLKRAAGQGLKASHLLSLLAKQTGGQIPPVFARALQRWESNGTEARIETLTVLKVSKPELLNELRASRVARFLGEIIGPTTVVIQAGAQSKVMAALAELGLLAEVEL